MCKTYLRSFIFIVCYIIPCLFKCVSGRVCTRINQSSSFVATASQTCRGCGWQRRAPCSSWRRSRATTKSSRSSSTSCVLSSSMWEPERAPECLASPFYLLPSLVQQFNSNIHCTPLMCLPPAGRVLPGATVFLPEAQSGPVSPAPASGIHGRVCLVRQGPGEGEEGPRSPVFGEERQHSARVPQTALCSQW